MTLTAEQEAAVRVYATAAAWAYHKDTLPEEGQVDLAASFLVHGDLRLVAADVLDAAALHASKQAAEGGGGVKRVKIEGEVEVERFAKPHTSSVDASAWSDRAVQLRQQVSRAGRSGPVPSPLAGIRTGGNTEPVFRVTQPLREAP
ncbi:hypothetical protein [Deinococcus murrayi]|uniref:hypothetical protein n=1 Tax=Deinococcus murrayi TaxID=68910 RepID=UPI0004838145|nr:hypothetical protein [Deinococcus murrayi]